MNGLKSLGKTRETATIGDGLKVLQKHLKPKADINALIPYKQIRELSPSIAKARGINDALLPFWFSGSANGSIQNLLRNNKFINKPLFPGTPAADKARTEEIVKFMRPYGFTNGRGHIWQNVTKLWLNNRF